MSIFDTQETKPEETTNETQTEVQTTESFVAKLVQARGEKWGDPEVIAKGKLEADEHIKALEELNKKLQEDLSKQDFAADLLKQLQTKDATTTSGTPVGSNSDSGTDQNDTSSKVSEDQIKSLVEQTITERDKQATVTQNINTVQDKLKELYGTEGNKVVQEKAKQLGISLSRMEELASESPNAFFSLLGEAPKRTQDFTKSTIRSDGVVSNTSGERTWQWYQELRKSNKDLYYSSKTQKQMLEDKKRLGDRFGN